MSSSRTARRQALESRSIFGRAPWIAACLLAASFSRPAAAADFHCSAGDVSCLIAAIDSANATVEADAILLDAGTYVLTAANNDTDGPNGLPSITTEISIQGNAAGDTFLQRGAPEDAVLPAFRIAHVSPSGSLELRTLTVRYGRLEDDGSGLLEGAGLFSLGSLRLTDCVVSGNDAAAPRST